MAFRKYAREHIALVELECESHVPQRVPGVPWRVTVSEWAVHESKRRWLSFLSEHSIFERRSVVGTVYRILRSRVCTTLSLIFEIRYALHSHA